MEQLLWSEHLSLNVPHIDQAHKKFLEQLAAVANSPEATLKEALVGLIRDMETDFRQEEALMEKICYPDIKPHREQHAGDPRRNRRKFRHRGLWSNGTVNRLKDF